MDGTATAATRGPDVDVVAHAVRPPTRHRTPWPPYGWRSSREPTWSRTTSSRPPTASWSSCTARRSRGPRMSSRCSPTGLLERRRLHARRDQEARRRLVVRARVRRERVPTSEWARAVGDHGMLIEAKTPEFYPGIEVELARQLRTYPVFERASCRPARGDVLQPRVAARVRRAPPECRWASSSGRTPLTGRSGGRPAGPTPSSPPSPRRRAHDRLGPCPRPAGARLDDRRRPGHGRVIGGAPMASSPATPMVLDSPPSLDGLEMTRAERPSRRTSPSRGPTKECDADHPQVRSCLPTREPVT